MSLRAGQTMEAFPRAFGGSTVAGRVIISAFGFKMRAALVACILAILLASSSPSAVGNGAIAGTVFGPGKTPIPGAKVTLMAADGNRQSIIADQQGHYSFSSLEPATYALSAEAAGHEPAARAGVEVAAGAQTTVDLTLPVAKEAPAAATAPLAYYDDTPLKAGAVTSVTDEAGYSSQAQSPRRLLSEGPSLAGATPGILPREPGTPATVATERELREALEANPNGFEPNRQMGEFYLSVGEGKGGIPYLERAQELKPGDPSNGYDLAAAYLAANDPAKAQTLLHDLLGREDTAELRNLSGKVEEALGDSTAAAKQFELAARMVPSEDNLFAWGNELLLHENIAPALEVFRRGTSLFPQSSRMYIGLGLALYSGNSYDAAIEALCHASDLDPADPRPYLFLGKLYNASATQANEVARRMQRFIETHPNNAYAYYYAALTMWKGSQAGEQSLDTDQVEALLKKSAALDPSLADPHRQLGILYHRLNHEPEAIAEFQAAVRLQPSDAETHYHLAQAYLRAGDKTRSQEELQIYDRLHQQQTNNR